jgi:putative membrane-bound dehydrogenase-like protein
MTRWVVFGCALCVAVLAGEPGLTGQTEGRPPYTPEQSIALMQIEDGFRVELVASEPDVQSPVAMEIDEHGRVFVVEMPGYPLDVSPTGRVRLLEDTTGDGRLDRSVVFADNLVLPSGVMRWKRGILVTAAPDLVYFEDSNGDGRADIREVVLTGFPRANPQSAVNHPVFGLDNWIYIAHSGGSEPVIYPHLFGDRGAPLTFPQRPEVPGFDIGPRGLRVKPDEYRVEALSSRTQFGNAFDKWGRFFAHNNSVHLRHEVIAARYLERNPHLALPSAMHEFSDHGNSNIVPITQGAHYDLLTEAGQFTSACGLTLYHGGAFPEAFDGSSFIAEPVHNLVHRDIIRPDGATFVGSRAQDGVEFLASGDAWFRPVNFYVGPEGALYVIDYYRPYIEHPEWASSDMQARPELFEEGRDRGRIYRIVPAGWPEGARTPRPRLGSASDAGLVEALGHANQWWRRTAQRLLVQDARRTAVPLLERLAAERPSALARLHALWALEGLGRLDRGLVLAALGDPEAGVRENALILSERWLPNQEVTRALLALQEDPDQRVRFQLLATLGFVDTPASRDAQDRLLIENIEDTWVQVAALSASSERAAAYVERALAPGSVFARVESPGRAAFFDRLGGVVAARGKADEVARAITAVAGRRDPGDEWWRASVIEGLARGMSGSRGDRRVLQAQQDPLLDLATAQQPRVRRAAVTLLGVSGIEPGPATTRALALAATTATDAAAPTGARVDALRLLALGDAPAHVTLFRSVVKTTEPEAVQVAGVQALGQLPGNPAAEFLLAQWPGLTSTVRSAVADVLLRQRDGSQLMLAALQDGTVKPWMLNFWQKRSLIMNRDEAIRREARVILEDSPEKRAAVMERYAAALAGRGDPGRGAGVFEQNCSMCHQIDGARGLELGPDLSTVRHKPMRLLLEDILEPNRSIAQHYETYMVERRSGDTVVGVLGEQSPTSITLRQAAGQEVTVPRGDIAQLTLVPQSSMPEQLDEQISPEEMADLLVFLTTRPGEATGPGDADR